MASKRGKRKKPSKKNIRRGIESFEEKVKERMAELILDPDFNNAVNVEIEELKTDKDIDTYMVQDIQRISEVEAEKEKVRKWIELGADQIAN